MIAEKGADMILEDARSYAANYYAEVRARITRQ
jgi:hypothetical protein